MSALRANSSKEAASLAAFNIAGANAAKAQANYST